MLKIGLTGGIGSGKSVVAKIFSVLQIPVLDADSFAKEIMNDNPEVKAQLLAAFGDEIFQSGNLDRSLLAQMVFNNTEKLKQLNAIVHPAVRKYGRIWMEEQHAPYVVKEAALFFESGSEEDMDLMVGVSAPESLRLSRAMNRDGVDEASVRKRMAAQMPQEEKMQRCDYVIYNDETHSLIEQVLHLHRIFIDQSAS